MLVLKNFQIVESFSVPKVIFNCQTHLQRIGNTYHSPLRHAENQRPWAITHNAHFGRSLVFSCFQSIVSCGV
jgi:hypothetical protein